MKKTQKPKQTLIPGQRGMKLTQDAAPCEVTVKMHYYPEKGIFQVRSAGTIIHGDKVALCPREIKKQLKSAASVPSKLQVN